MTKQHPWSIDQEPVTVSDDEADRYSHLIERRRTPEFDREAMTPPDDDDDGGPGGVALLVLAILLSWGLAYALFIAARAAWRLT